ncbi:MAG: hypothetical protein J5606_02385 [Bacteroidales bacterium]|nr:hypothetical protein [Bacteroidales bacterium]
MKKLFFLPLVVAVAGLLFCTACKKKEIKEEQTIIEQEDTIIQSYTHVSDCKDIQMTNNYEVVFVKAINNKQLEVSTSMFMACCGYGYYQDIEVKEDTNISLKLSWPKDEESCNCSCLREIVFLIDNLEQGKTYSITLFIKNYEYCKFGIKYEKNLDFTFKL